MIISGNASVGLAKALFKLYPAAVFCSKSNGFDLCKENGMQSFAELAVNHDIIIINSALWRFNQTVLLDVVYKSLINAQKTAHIVCIGSTTDRVNKGTSWLYNAEKKALRDYCNSLSLLGVWNGGPRVSYISFGTLSNNQHKHVDRVCLDIDVAAKYIQWLIDQPVHINEISIDPVQISSH